MTVSMKEDRSPDSLLGIRRTISRQSARDQKDNQDCLNYDGVGGRLGNEWTISRLPDVTE